MELTDAELRRAVADLVSGRAAGEKRLPLLSGSMAPAILPGDLVRVRPVSSKRPRFAEIVVFLRAGRLSAHRIVFSWPLPVFLLEMGDANERAERLPRRSVLGTVSAVERADGSVYEAAPDARARRIARASLARFLRGALKRTLKRMLGKT